MASSTEISVTLEIEYEAEATLTLDDVEDSLLSIDGIYVGGEAPQYQGAYEATPTQQTQVFPTGGYVMASDFIVNPIPSNYGLITYNGSTITVS